MDRVSLAGRLRWWKFRWRVTRATLWWLAYALYKRKPELIAMSERGATPYDLPGLDLVRRALRIAAPGAR